MRDDDHERNDHDKDQLCKTNFHSVPIPFLKHRPFFLGSALLYGSGVWRSGAPFVALCIPDVNELYMNLF